MMMPSDKREQRAEERNQIVQLAALSSDLWRSSTTLLFSPSATSSESVEFFTHEDASFCR